MEEFSFVAVGPVGKWETPFAHLEGTVGVQEAFSTFPWAVFLLLFFFLLVFATICGRLERFPGSKTFQPGDGGNGPNFRTGAHTQCVARSGDVGHSLPRASPEDRTAIRGPLWSPCLRQERYGEHHLITSIMINGK